ncbi:MAG TPA: hypothetical protein VGV38_09080, partial [Pyrinomonadaceae bacterium]|nr:hypothetical protein [Pyrinomonadaceae bacterium]
MYTKKRIAFLALGLALLAAGVFLYSPNFKRGAGAQDEAGAVAGLKPQVAQAAAYASTRAVRDFEQVRAAEVTDEIRAGSPVQRLIRRVPNQGLPRAENREGVTANRDEALQTDYPEAQAAELNIPTPETSFDGLSSDDNAAVHGSRWLPPDTVGDVGPNHYVQAVNTLVRVFDKTGTPLTNAFLMSQLFSAVGAPCGTTDDGDPIILYDQAADRWL